MKDDVLISLLVFGDLGAEYITGETDQEITEDYITMLSNYYAAVLGAAHGNKGLFGPLPVAHFHQRLILVYGFDAKDTTIKDMRVMSRGGITTAFMLIIIPSKDDERWSVNRKMIINKLTTLSKELLASEIRQVKIERLKKTIEDIKGEIEKNFLIVKQKISQFKEIGKYTGKWLNMIENTAVTREKQLNISMISRDDQKLFSIIQDAVFVENRDQLIVYRKDEEDDIKRAAYQLQRTKIEVQNMPLDNRYSIEKHLVSKNWHGVLYSAKLSHDDAIGVVEEDVKFILANLSHNCPLSIVLDTDEGVQLNIRKTAIPATIAKKPGLTINLANLNDTSINMETIVSSFSERIMEKAFSI